jgi:predicted O-linked N-acetylglucosamine transferase (SPINDLY family)
MALQLAGHLAQAEEIYRTLLHHTPDHAPANYCIGMLHVQTQRAAAAIPFLLKALESNPQNPDYWLGLLEGQLAAGHIDDAIATLEQGERHGLAGQAVTEFRTRLDSAARLAAMEEAEGHLLAAMERVDTAAAITHARDLVTRFPARGLGWKVLGALLWARDSHEEALAAMHRAVLLLPRDAEAHVNLGFALAKADRFVEAETCLATAIELDPTFATAHYRLAMIHLMQSRLSEAEASLRRGIACRAAYTDGDDEANFSTLLFLMSHNPEVTAEALFAEHCRFGEYFEDPTTWPIHANDRDPNRRIKVGLVSGDLRKHALADYLEPLLERLHGRQGLEFHAYSNNEVEDQVSQRIKKLVASWNRISGLSNAEFAQRIQDDGVDILLDLSGHTALNRLPAFARKPAPVQVSGIGYPGTTGLRSMDYYLADKEFLPAGAFDRYFTEKLVHLPAVAPFKPHATAPAIASLPALSNNYLTFGSFNRPEKINSHTIRVWSQLLLRLPEAKMVLGHVRLASVRDTLVKEFAACGITADRLQIHPPYDMDRYLALHAQVDICLDTMPYNGGTTTLHALWMGVPTLTLAGSTPAGRAGAAILSAVGLPKLARLRSGLRDRWEHSRPRKVDVIADEFDEALRRMWKRWCTRRPAKSFCTSNRAKTRGPQSRKMEAEERLLMSLVERRDFDTAVRLARSLTERYPERSIGWKIYGAFLPTTDGYEHAIAALQTAVRLVPRDPEAHTNLGLTLAKAKRPKEGEAHLRRALDLKPDFAPAHYRLSIAYEFQGRFAEAEASLRRGIALRANQVAGDEELSHSRLLFLMSHNADIGPDELFAEHRRFGARLEDPLRGQWPQHSNDRNPHRVLKIGFVSGDLCNHAVTTFLEPVLVELAKLGNHELHAYYTNPDPDMASQRLLCNFKSWNIVASLTDPELADVIRKDAIDILFDLSGHTAFNRLPAFARKPAPIQVSWMGYPGTTGLRAMDYYLADPHFLPPGHFDNQFTEKLVYTPPAPFQQHMRAPPVNPLPALTNGHVTFGAFNRLGKMNDATLALWAQVMRELPDSRILIAGIEIGSHDALLIDRFADLGVTSDRLQFHARCGILSYLALFHQVDLCLDTTPYTGGTTTLHALWMGVPTLTLSGHTPASRQGTAILGHVGLHDFIAASTAEFVSKGRHWATHIAALAEVRAQLRDRWLQSPFLNADVLAQSISGGLRHMWQRWCDGLPPESFHTAGSSGAAALRKDPTPI